MNSVLLSGTVVTENISMRRTPEGSGVTSFVLKVLREPRKGSAGTGNGGPGGTGGSLKDNQPAIGSDYITIVCWNAMADFVVSKMHAGMKIEVRGSIRTGKRVMKGYTLFKEGEPVTDFRLPVLEVHAQKIEIL